jgi:hypothetical protein
MERILSVALGAATYRCCFRNNPPRTRRLDAGVRAGQERDARKDHDERIDPGAMSRRLESEERDAEVEQRRNRGNVLRR